MMNPESDPSSPPINPPPVSLADSTFIGGGEMGKLVRAKDWVRTPLGPIESWPTSLRTAVSLVLDSNFPIALVWGPQHIQIYNDGYRPICGDKHPTAMGQDFTECWASAFPVIGDAFRSALAGGAAFLEDQRMFLDRLGYLEEAFFTFSFSPIRDEHGAVVGLFHPVTETTGRMLSERRTRSLRELTAIGLGAASLDDALRRCAQALAEAALDLPLVLFYRFDEEGRGARLVAQAGLAPGAAASPEWIDLMRDDAAWPLAKVGTGGTALAVDDLRTRFPGLVCGPYPEPIAAARLLPIAPPGFERALAVMVVGVSTRLPLSDAYASFFELLGATVGNVVASAMATETERQRAAALAEIDRAKIAFFANISHEFRTPLTLMLGPLEDELAERSAPLPTPRRERIAAAHRNSLRLLKLVNALLDFSHIEAGRANAAFQPTDLAAYTAELASVFRSAVEKAGLRLKVDCPALPEPVFVDRDMWEKVVFNLLSNALKHTFTGGIRVALSWRGDHVELEVADTGSGIPAADLPHLFERFHRVRGAPSRTHEGTGIGLSLVQELIRLHGGTVRVASEVGEGSSFTATLKAGRAHLADAQIGASAAPVAPASQAGAYVAEAMQWIADAAEAPAAPALAMDAPRERIVWADDNTDMRDYVSRLLGEHYAVTAVSNGLQAVAAAVAAPPDLVLTDIMMPGLDGYGVLRELRAHPSTRHIPVILLSARAGEEAVLDGLSGGADDYLVKPFAARELLSRVRTHLNLAKLRREWAAEQVHATELEHDAAQNRQLLTTAGESRRALLGILEDQQRAEAARRDSEQKLHLMLDAANIGHWDLDLVTHAANRSRRHDQIFGYEEEPPDWTYEKFLAHVHPEDCARVDQAFKAGVAAKTQWEFECRITRRNGVLRWIWVHGKVFTGAAGDAQRMVGMVRDITERKQAEDAVRESEARYRTLFEYAPDGIVIFSDDPDRYLIDGNASLFRMLGYTRDELIKLRPADIVLPAEIVQIAPAISVIKADSAYAREWQFQRKDASNFTGEVIATPMPDGNLMALIRDITERKQAEAELLRLHEALQRHAVELEQRVAERTEQLEAANQGLEAFSYSVSHDLKAPLRGIDGYSLLLEQGYGARLEGDALIFLRNIRQGAAQMHELIDDLLTYSRMERRHIDPTELDLAACVNAVTAEYAQEMAERGVTLSVEVPTVTVRADRDGLAIVLRNLLDNAIKFSKDAQPPQITISAESALHKVTLLVRDNGIGFDMKFHDRIFEMFNRLQRAEDYPGTGVGLALVHKAMHRMGGSVRAESTPGAGATFFLEIPA